MKQLRYFFLYFLPLLMAGVMSSCADLYEPMRNIPDPVTLEATSTEKQPFILQGKIENYSNDVSCFFLVSTDASLSDATQYNARLSDGIYYAYPELSYDMTYYYALAASNGNFTVQGDVLSLYVENPYKNNDATLKISGITQNLFGVKGEYTGDYCYAVLLNSDGFATGSIFQIVRDGDSWVTNEEVELSEEDQYLACWVPDTDIADGLLYLKYGVRKMPNQLYGISEAVTNSRPTTDIVLKSPYSRVTYELTSSESNPLTFAQMYIAGDHTYYSGWFNMLTGITLDGNVESLFLEDEGNGTIELTYYLLPVEKWWGTENVTLYYTDGTTQEKTFSTPEEKAYSLLPNENYVMHYDCAQEPAETRYLTITELWENIPDPDILAPTPWGCTAVFLNSDKCKISDTFKIYADQGTGEFKVVDSDDQPYDLEIPTEAKYVLAWDAPAPDFSNQGIPEIALNSTCTEDSSVYGLEEIKSDGSVSIGMSTVYANLKIELVNNGSQDITISQIELSGSSIYSEGTYYYNVYLYEYITKAQANPYVRSLNLTIPAGQSSSYDGLFVIPITASNTDTQLKAIDSEGNVYTLDIPDCTWKRCTQYNYEMPLTNGEESSDIVKIGTVTYHENDNNEYEGYWILDYFSNLYGMKGCLVNASNQVTSESVYLSTDRTNECVVLSPDLPLSNEPQRLVCYAADEMYDFSAFPMDSLRCYGISNELTINNPTANIDFYRSPTADIFVSTKVDHEIYLMEVKLQGSNIRTDGIFNFFTGEIISSEPADDDSYVIDWYVDIKTYVIRTLPTELIEGENWFKCTYKESQSDEEVKTLIQYIPAQKWEAYGSYNYTIDFTVQ